MTTQPTQPTQPPLPSPYPDDELATRFTYHPPKPDQPEIYEAIRDQAHAYARLIIRTSPRCREQDIALARLEEVVMWANAAVARRS